MWKWIKGKLIWIFIGGVALVSGTVAVLPEQPVGRETATSTPQTIEQKLEDKTGKQKVKIKGQEIAKIDFTGEHTVARYGIKVDIISIKAFDGGVEVFAKAWKGNKQLGFGKDGSVEIERFLIYNPPILVDDPNGTIVREWTDDITGELQQRKLREDPAEAIRSDLAHTISVVGKENTQIVKDKIGNTTSTFRSNAGTGTALVDGVAARSIGAGSETFATLRSTAGNSANTTSTNSNPGTIQGSTITNSETTTALVSGDYNEARHSDTRLATAINTTAYDTGDGSPNNWTLNASGLTVIEGNVIKYLSVRSKWDVDDSFTGTWGSTAVTQLYSQLADQSGTDKDPKLVVVHTPAPAVGVNQVMIID